jgi:peptidoglycan/xylan/chitin deacetylase (PgdA/CDA1 family)
MPQKARANGTPPVLRALARGKRVIFVRKLNIGRIAARRLVAGAATAAAVIAMFAAVNAPAFIGASSSARELPIYCVRRDNKAASLTFDAAWGNEDTQRLIDILGKYGVKATFFIVGEWAEKYPESVKALYDAGHEIGNHSDDHAHFNPLSPEEIARNISACNEKISAVTGAAPTLFRAPYGEYDNEVIRTVKSLGMDTIQWDVDTLHPTGVNTKDRAR